MKKFSLSIFTYLLVSSVSANAQVSPSIVGINYGGDPTITVGFPYATGVVPYYTAFDRLYDSIRGATAHATWWSTLNPSAGNYTFTTNLDPILTAEAAKGKITEYTLSGVPAYVSGSQSVVGSTQLGQFSTFLTAMMTHVAANKQCFGYFSLWNEVNQPSNYWSGTAAQMAALAVTAYPIIKSSCPKTVVLTPSVTSGVDTGSSPNPNGPFQYFAAYLAAGGAAVTDGLNVHGYPETPSLQTPNASVAMDPFLLVNTITSMKAVGLAAGLSSPTYLDEGYACSDPASTSVPANTNAYAACQANQLVIAAFAGVQSYANSFFGAGCTIPACGNEFSPTGTLKLTPAGLVKRNLINWFSGATASGTFFRSQGANLITVAPNDASVATGNIGGLGGGGCPSPPAGTGSLPVGASPWGLSATASIAGGMSYYVVGSGTSGGLPYIDVRICGTDVSGANSDSIRMNNFTGAATIGQNVVDAACIGLVAGSLNGIQETDLQVNEYTSVPAYAGQFMVQSQIQPVSTSLVPVTQQCFQTRYVMTAGTAAFAVPYILVKHYGSVAIDATFRIASPHLDVNSTRWQGVITKSGGYTATIAVDASGAGSITAPAGSVNWRDIFGGVHKTTGGATIQLTNSPILIENKVQTSWTPIASTPGFFVNPGAGGNDSFAGTISKPFASLNKCHTAMQASITIKTCYPRGAITAALWTQGSNETWRNYPGDSAYSTNITLTGTSSGCNSCTNLTIRNLVINGSSATAFTALFNYGAAAINFWDNHVTLTGVVGAINAFNLNNTNIQGNTTTAPVANSGTNVLLYNLTNTDNLPHSNVTVSDNLTIGGGAFPYQAQTQGTVTVLTNYHFDRNTITNFGDPTFPSFGIIGISWVGADQNNTQVTMSGNVVSQPNGNTKSDVGFEIDVRNITAQNNTITNLKFGYSMGTGGNYLGNTSTMTSSPPTVFTQSTVYSGPNTWIGNNTINSVLRTGCVTGAGGCTLSPAPSGSQGTLWPASPVWNQ